MPARAAFARAADASAASVSLSIWLPVALREASSVALLTEPEVLSLASPSGRVPMEMTDTAPAIPALRPPAAAAVVDSTSRTLSAVTEISPSAVICAPEATVADAPLRTSTTSTAAPTPAPPMPTPRLPTPLSTLIRSSASMNTSCAAVPPKAVSELICTPVPTCASVVPLASTTLMVPATPTPPAAAAVAASTS